MPWLRTLPADDNDETLTTIREELADMNNFTEQTSVGVVMEQEL
jgi:hypothetical protein